MNKAILLETEIKGLSLSCGSDGVWLNLEADGKSASINLVSEAYKQQGIIGEAMLAWCTQTAVAAGLVITNEATKCDELT